MVFAWFWFGFGNVVGKPVGLTLGIEGSASRAGTEGASGSPQMTILLIILLAVGSRHGCRGLQARCRLGAMSWTKPDAMLQLAKNLPGSTGEEFVFCLADCG